MKVLFLDFDGVIVNSIEECFTVANHAYTNFKKDDVIESNSIKNMFYKHRGLVGPVYQYFVLLEVLGSLQEFSEVGDDCIERKFYALEKEMALKDRCRYEELFFNCRETLRNKDINAWLELNGLTSFGVSLIDRSLGDTYIITTKDRESVQLLLEYHKISVKGIYDKECYKKYGSKGGIIREFVEKKCRSEDEIIFIDDCVKHLDSAGAVKVKCLFAGWGYGKNSTYQECSNDFNVLFD